ncbi:exodeoxyribonuclease VII large subunit [Sediminispirochaeta smaragdinae]|uniref:Exodeoxyribonuclease 7 large subunit n=1 Tax=Sediminispirochaeta smaragdinae (strain DSM 11293 / JCM 15392 / SEBR 4228) TaxID=573413 RepID=E1R448_SEDSS|nr:exodeoxyribonuclease VII large subunit [Sediminispirochaeta smaragdinae]ADK80470.1 exodeoxyribonuclease VII, large subunit [Sediminispirochaeta smaragdinae DSM 11293]
MLFEEESKAFYTVSGLTALIKERLESGFSSVAVEGEISNFRPSAAGHWYFSLKDQDAVISAVMFRGKSARVDFYPEDGITVKISGNLSVYEKRGNYQIICDTMVRSGEGAILAMLEERKRRLAAEGLFDLEKKKPIPPFPARVAVITSPTGAALRDILQVLGRRGAGVDITILPTLVQGDGAAEQIAAQIRRANRYNMGEVIIIGRGGGSLEDLLPFSEEAVARAVAESTIPIISAVGHETDTALSDLAADLRAPTPSAAAELVCEEREALLLRVGAIAGEMRDNLLRGAEKARILLQRFSGEEMKERMQRLLQPRRLELDDQREEAVRAIGEKITAERHRLALIIKELETSNPLAILQKGYAVVSRKRDNGLVTDAAEERLGEALCIRLAKGSVDATIEEIHSEKL